MNKHILPGKVSGTVSAPPSKSLTHRAIILATLAHGESVIENCLLADDTKATIEACRGFGAEIFQEGNTLRIKGLNGELRAPSQPIDCGLSGTTLRFALALAALVPGETVFTGGKRLLERPVHPLFDALKAVGAEIHTGEGGIRVKGGIVKGGTVTLPGNVSSQFISALLMVGPYFSEGIAIMVEEPFYSRPYVDLTIDLMRAFGVEVRSQGNQYAIEPGQFYEALTYTVEGDYSSAQYWFAAAAITGGEVTVEGLNPDSRQGDRRLLDIVKGMGCEVSESSQAIAVRGTSRLRSFSVDGRDIPDVVPTLVVLAAAANGVSEVTSVGHLRGKESDRLSAPVEELKKMGIRAEVMDDALRVHGGILKAAVMNPHGDHRLAMAFTLAGLAAEGETVMQDAEVVSKSYPGFWDDLVKLGGRVK